MTTADLNKIGLIVNFPMDGQMTGLQLLMRVSIPRMPGMMVPSPGMPQGPIII